MTEDKKQLIGVFDTLFSSKEADHGRGSGLALCRALIDDQQGEIKIFSKYGVSAEVRVPAFTIGF